MHEFTENEREDDLLEENEEVSVRLIKSKPRVQKHGEVFTPKWMVKIMLNQPEVRKACNELETTFLEIILQRLIQFNDCTTDLHLAG